MVKKIIIRNLNSSLKYLALGKIKIYDNNNNTINNNECIISNDIICESENMICKVKGSNIGSYPINLINNSDSYWISNTKNNVDIEIQFKQYINGISKISFIPLPSQDLSIGVTEPFDIDIYDYSDNLLQTYNIIPTINKLEETIIITPEMNKYYIESQYGILYTNDSMQVHNVKNISSIEVYQYEPENTKIRYAFSIDNRNSWFTIKNNNITNIDIADINNNGMTKDDMECINNFSFENITNLDIVMYIITTKKEYTPIFEKIKIYYY